MDPKVKEALFKEPTKIIEFYHGLVFQAMNNTAPIRELFKPVYDVLCEVYIELHSKEALAETEEYLTELIKQHGQPYDQLMQRDDMDDLLNDLTL